MKISNKLLSWVLGCECEFGTICQDSKCGEVAIDSIYFRMFIKQLNKPRFMPKKLNLDTFIRLAKIKAWSEFYQLEINGTEVNIEHPHGNHLLYGKPSKPFSQDLMIEALEWVCNEVQK